MKRSGDLGAEGLHRGLGVWSVVLMVLAGAAPLASVGAVLPMVVRVSQNPVLPMFFIGATMILALFAIGFTRMTRFVGDAGAFYSYIQTGLGRIPGVGAAALAISSYFLLLVSISCYLGAVTATTVAHLGGPGSPWWLWTALWLVLTGVLGYRDIELSSKVLAFMLVAECVVVVVVDVALIAAGEHLGGNARLAMFDPTALSRGVPSLGLMFAFLCFVGFETTAVFRSEAFTPERTLPRATYIAVIGIGLFYAISAWALTVGVGADNLVAAATDDPANLVVGLAKTHVGPAMQDTMQLLLLPSLFACTLTFHNVSTRYVFTMGTRGLLPRAVGVVHAKHRSPARASLAITTVTAVAALLIAAARMDPVTKIYPWLSGTATLGVVVLMSLTSLAVVIFFWTQPGTGESTLVSTRIVPVIALFCLAGLAWIVVSNFVLLIGDVTASRALLAGIVATFIAGMIVAGILRTRRPHAYRALTQPIPEVSGGVV
ncbi:APC family permease [Mycobacterium haemophilum]|uniref:Amino acid permease/ SLC12A domain-containing protein n=1 Tax=Mycobacterium haemophilum TaxID=29311 RepID=A0A0I9TRA1_9MYCO|nr:APC family permease [Mycobacterium haemophilum]KLO31213.1 hypothetical protein ABH39_09155 [Mycobacterium haemophilum]KLO36138.1 hypothetical protein ABH38_13075 [Mycobacterium haemophilum]KLO41986.1 hypothetical protein ABH37_11705 [Mycobacterium haemophilum]KLO49896.1 hypothetical protein ABH36_09625 [Mycobacterium haemophilum]